MGGERRQHPGAPLHNDSFYSMTTTRMHSAVLAMLLCVACGAGRAQTESGKPAQPEAAKASPAETAKPAPAEAAKAAAEACETAVAETVRRMRGKAAQEVQFIGAKRALSPTPDEQTGVKGEGRYRGASGDARTFTYSCAYNVETGATSGVMFGETGPARPVAAEKEKPWQPDLTNFSPEACEAATAAVLKEKYPRVARIAFGSDSRKLRPAANDLASLEGAGGVVRAAGMSAIPFTYRCEFEPRSGKVVSVKTSE
jgi:hypothetical protein